MKYDKVYRVFLSSVGKLLEYERDAIREHIWKSGNLPIAMEGFNSSNNKYSIEVVIDYLNKSDIVIMVLGHLYGEIINGLEKSSCSLRTCNKCNGDRCCISYTHFEYLYSMEKNKLVFCIVENNYKDIKSVRKKLKDSKYRGDEAQKILESFKKDKTVNSDFIKAATEKYSYFYSNPAEILQSMLKINRYIHANPEKYNLVGLVDGSVLNELTKVKSEKEKINNDIKVLNELHITSNNYPIIFSKYKAICELQNLPINSCANIILGLMYELGIGTAEDFPLAKKQYQKAFDLGSDLGSYLLERNG